MNFLNEIEDNSILIIDNNIKTKILDYINDNKILKQVKIMNMQELKKELFFDYSNEAIFRVMKNFNLDYNVARKYISNLYYLEDKTYDNPKYQLLCDIKDFLDSKNLLIRDPLFKNLLDGKNIYVFGFDYIDSFNKYMLSKLDNVSIIEKKNSKFNHEAIEFNNMQDEITYICESIESLISNGVDLNKIYIANADDTYFFTMKRIFKSYNIPYYLKSNTSLYDTAIGEYAIENFSNNFYSLMNKIKRKFDVDNNEFNNKVYLKVKSLLDTYFWVKDEDIKELFIEESKRCIIGVNHCKKEITTTNILNNVFNDDEYVFLINFNQGSIPKIKKDIDYLNDDIKPSFLSKSYEYNRDIKESLIKSIANIKNLTITYKKSNFSGECLPSPLIESDNIIVSKGKEIISKYSDLNNKIMLASKLNRLLKFNEMDEDTIILSNNYDIHFNEYNHKYKKIDKNNLIKNIDGLLNFSYSNIEKYYECPFKFYVKYILKIDEYNDTIDTLIGNAFHHTLEVYERDKEDPSKIYDEYIKSTDMTLTNKDKFFIKTLKEEILFIIDVLDKQYEHFSITKQEFEASKVLEVKSPFNTTIKGRVDKIIYMGNKVFIVDYKTGEDKMESKLFEFGLNLQLPIYLYLLNELEKDTVVQGIYLQHLLSQKKVFSVDKKETRENSLKLDGITFGPIDNIKDMDDTYEKSTVITGLSYDTKNGDLKYGKRVRTIEERNDLIALVKEKIYDCVEDVSNVKFDIKPIKIDKYIDGCKYCPYKDICFKVPSDYDIKKITKGDDE